MFQRPVLLSQLYHPQDCIFWISRGAFSLLAPRCRSAPPRASRTAVVRLGPVSTLLSLIPGRCGRCRQFSARPVIPLTSGRLFPAAQSVCQWQGPRRSRIGATHYLWAFARNPGWSLRPLPARIAVTWFWRKCIGLFLTQFCVCDRQTFGTVWNPVGGAGFLFRFPGNSATRTPQWHGRASYCHYWVLAWKHRVLVSFAGRGRQMASVTCLWRWETLCPLRGLGGGNNLPTSVTCAASPSCMGGCIGGSKTLGFVTNSLQMRLF